MYYTSIDHKKTPAGELKYTPFFFLDGVHAEFQQGVLYTDYDHRLCPLYHENGKLVQIPEYAGLASSDFKEIGKMEELQSKIDDGRHFIDAGPYIKQWNEEVGDEYDPKETKSRIPNMAEKHIMMFEEFATIRTSMLKDDPNKETALAHPKLAQDMLTFDTFRKFKGWKNELEKDKKEHVVQTWGMELGEDNETYENLYNWVHKMQKAGKIKDKGFGRDGKIIFEGEYHDATDRVGDATLKDILEVLQDKKLKKSDFGGEDKSIDHLAELGAKMNDVEIKDLGADDKKFLVGQIGAAHGAGSGLDGEREYHLDPAAGTLLVTLDDEHELEIRMDGEKLSAMYKDLNKRKHDAEKKAKKPEAPAAPAAGADATKPEA